MLKWKRSLLIDFNNCRVTTPCRRYQSPRSGPTAWEQREDLARGSRDTTGARAAPPPQNLTGLSLFCVTALLLVPGSACHGTGICLAFPLQRSCATLECRLGPCHVQGHTFKLQVTPREGMFRGGIPDQESQTLCGLMCSPRVMLTGLREKSRGQLGILGLCLLILQWDRSGMTHPACFPSLHCCLQHWNYGLSTKCRTFPLSLLLSPRS